MAENVHPDEAPPTEEELPGALVQELTGEPAQRRPIVWQQGFALMMGNPSYAHPSLVGWRAALAEVPPDERETVAEKLLRHHFGGRGGDMDVAAFLQTVRSDVLVVPAVSEGARLALAMARMLMLHAPVANYACIPGARYLPGMITGDFFPVNYRPLYDRLGYPWPFGLRVPGYDGLSPWTLLGNHYPSPGPHGVEFLHMQYARQCLFVAVQRLSPETIHLQPRHAMVAFGMVTQEAPEMDVLIERHADSMERLHTLRTAEETHRATKGGESTPRKLAALVDGNVVTGETRFMLYTHFIAGMCRAMTSCYDQAWLFSRTFRSATLVTYTRACLSATGQYFGMRYDVGDDTEAMHGPGALGSFIHGSAYYVDRREQPHDGRARALRLPRAWASMFTSTWNRRGVPGQGPPERNAGHSPLLRSLERGYVRVDVDEGMNIPGIPDPESVNKTEEMDIMTGLFSEASLPGTAQKRYIDRVPPTMRAMLRLGTHPCVPDTVEALRDILLTTHTYLNGIVRTYHTAELGTVKALGDIVPSDILPRFIQGDPHMPSYQRDWLDKMDWPFVSVLEQEDGCSSLHGEETRYGGPHLFRGDLEREWALDAFLPSVVTGDNITFEHYLRERVIGDSPHVPNSRLQWYALLVNAFVYMCRILRDYRFRGYLAFGGAFGEQPGDVEGHPLLDDGYVDVTRPDLLRTLGPGATHEEIEKFDAFPWLPLQGDVWFKDWVLSDTRPIVGGLPGRYTSTNPHKFPFTEVDQDRAARGWGIVAAYRYIRSAQEMGMNHIRSLVQEARYAKTQAEHADILAREAEAVAELRFMHAYREVGPSMIVVDYASRQGHQLHNLSQAPVVTDESVIRMVRDASRPYPRYVRTEPRAGPILSPDSTPCLLALGAPELPEWNEEYLVKLRAIEGELGIVVPTESRVATARHELLFSGPIQWLHTRTRFLATMRRGTTFGPGLATARRGGGGGFGMPPSDVRGLQFTQREGLRSAYIVVLGREAARGIPRAPANMSLTTYKQMLHLPERPVRAPRQVRPRQRASMLDPELRQALAGPERESLAAMRRRIASEHGGTRTTRSTAAFTGEVPKRLEDVEPAFLAKRRRKVRWGPGRVVGEGGEEDIPESLRPYAPRMRQVYRQGSVRSGKEDAPNDGESTPEMRRSMAFVIDDGPDDFTFPPSALSAPVVIDTPPAEPAPLRPAVLAVPIPEEVRQETQRQADSATVNVMGMAERMRARKAAALAAAAARGPPG